VCVSHGPWVEGGDGFACEAVWPARFEEGDFDRAAVVAGTGVRARDGEVTFVSSASAIDRLHSAELPEGPVVSNSLPCLLRAIGAEARLDYWRYQVDLQTVMRGLGRYRPVLPTTVPPVRLTYFHNLVWGGTVSSGYDGAAVTTLAAEVGCREALTFDESRLGEPDSGEATAEALGLEAVVLTRATWRGDARRSERLYEAPFFAAMPTGHLAPFGAAREQSWRPRGDHRLLRGLDLESGSRGPDPPLPPRLLGLDLYGVPARGGLHQLRSRRLGRSPDR